MNKNVFLITAALATSLCGVGCNKSGKLNQPSTVTTRTGATELKLKWPAGEHIVQSIAVTANMDISGTNLPSPVHQDMTFGEDYGLHVVSADADGGHELEMEYLGLRMKIDQGGKSLIDYDSAKNSSNSAKDPALASVDKMFQSVIGAKIRFFTDASNQVERVEGLDTLMNGLAAGGRGDAASSLKSMFSEDSLKQMIGTEHLPSKPVQPGDSWPVQTDITMGNLGKVAMDLTTTFERWETHGQRNCARLEVQGSLKGKANSGSAAPGMTFAVQDGDVSGVAWFDPELGLVIETIMNQNMNVNIAMPMPGRKNATQSMAMAMKQEITMKVESVK
ncbi:MAG TPA: DUF6263 family protein [Verrucomicrobiae bacterium]|nr:DUF6263 family protein [Verrucomicrobiae bacterium]